MFGRLKPILLAAIGLCCLSTVLASSPALADKRVALVIGESAYQHIAPLRNPLEDARAVAQMFRDAGFDSVDLRVDLDNAGLRRAVREFTRQANEADVAVVYFSGHGLQLYGANYLVPIDAHLASDLDVDDEGLPLDRLVASTDGAKRLRLVILDACRPNNLAAAMRLERREGQLEVKRSAGLGASEPARRDTLIAYAAKAGATSIEGDGPHSLFTTALLKSLTTPGLDLRLALGRIMDSVMKATGGQQQPYVYGAVYADDAVLVPRTAATQERTEEVKADYELVDKIGTATAYNAFLKAHPTGDYADRARVKVKELTNTPR
jgi:uncharacterized caspase-like protein